MNKTYIKITLLFTSSLTIMAGATIAPSLPQIQQVFIAEPQSEILTKLILTVPALFIAVCAPPAGLFIDRFGRMKLMRAALIGYGLSGTAVLFLQDIYLILASRALLGVAVAGVMTTTITLIADYFSGMERDEFMGLQGAFVALGGVIFITGGGLLADIGWRYPFAIYASAFIILPAAYFYLYEPRVKRRSAPDDDIREDNYQKSLVVLIYLTALLGMMLFYIIPLQIPFYIKEQTGVGNTLTGIAIACSTLSSAVVSLNYKRIKARWGFPMIYFFSFLFLGIGYLIIFQASGYLGILSGLLTGGIGMGVLIPNSNVWIVTLSPESMRGRIVGGLTTAVFIGQFISPFFIQPILEHTGAGQIFLIAALGMSGIALAYLGFAFFVQKALAPSDEKI
jgi:MFS family permease